MEQEQRDKECGEMAEEIAEKDREIAALNDIITETKEKLAQLEAEQLSYEVRGSLPVDPSSLLFTKEENIFEGIEEVNFSRNNSICLSLAEAETLKNHIEEKEVQHRDEVSILRKEQEAVVIALKTEVENLTVKLTLSYEAQSGLQVKCDELEVKVKELSHSLDEHTRSQERILETSQDEAIFLYVKRIAELETALVDGKSEKMRLLEHITHLQKQLCLPLIQEEDELEDLLEKCVEELEHERQANLTLRIENNKLRRHANRMRYHESTPTAPEEGTPL